MPSALYQNAAALSGLVVWYGVFVLLERHDRWCWFRPLLPLLAGCLSFRALGWYLGAIHPVIVPHLEHLAGGRRLVLFIHDVGLREEAVKLLFALPCMLWLKSRPAPQSALTAAAMVGLGFATAENRWFFGGHAEPTLLVGRVFSTTALHVASTGLCGAALSQAWQIRPQAWSRFLTVFLAVVVAHGLYDWAPGSAWIWLRAGGTSWLSQVVVITLLAWFFGLYHRTLPMRAPPVCGPELVCDQRHHAVRPGTGTDVGTLADSGSRLDLRPRVPVVSASRPVHRAALALAAKG